MDTGRVLTADPLLQGQCATTESHRKTWRKCDNMQVVRRNNINSEMLNKVLESRVKCRCLQEDELDTQMTRWLEPNGNSTLTLKEEKMASTRI